MSLVENNLNINFNGSLALILVLLLGVLGFVFLYRTRGRVGFWLRKKWPIQLWRDSIGDRKPAASILFIDDNDSPIASTLSDDGFRVAKARDARVDDAKVRDANIIFVDYKGVGTRISAEQQGIALANAIKSQWGHRKFVILYSAQEYVEPVGSKADVWLKKGASFADYMDKIQKACFTLFP